MTNLEQLFAWVAFAFAGVTLYGFLAMMWM